VLLYAAARPLKFNHADLKGACWHARYASTERDTPTPTTSTALGKRCGAQRAVCAMCCVWLQRLPCVLYDKCPLSTLLLRSWGDILLLAKMRFRTCFKV
jgi:hypothetical protein